MRSPNLLRSLSLAVALTALGLWPRGTVAADATMDLPNQQRVSLDGITFDSRFPCGNGHDFRKVGPNHYRFRARAGREPYAWRFYFKIECPDAAGREITLEVADFNHAGRTLFHEGATVWSTDDRHWTSLDPQRMAIVDSTPTGRAEIDARYGDRAHVPYGVRYRLRLAAGPMWFASPTPYALARRDACLARLAAAHPDLVQLIAVGESRHSRSHGYPVRAARIAKRDRTPALPNIVVIAGEHSAESAGMYACEGWMEEVLAHRDWLDRYAFCFVPVVNVDGVCCGTTYHNVPATPGDGPGENMSVDWREPKQPEIRALRALVLEWRPVFFASLHNGRHRSSLEALGPTGPESDALLAAWRRALGLPVEGIRFRAGSRAFNVLSEQNITPMAYTVETLLLVRQEGCSSMQESYLLTGRQLARGTVAALDARPETAAPAAADRAPAQPPKVATGLRFAAADFTAQLPWFYHGMPFERWQGHDVYSFEVNGLEIPPGEYAVALLPQGARASLAVGFDGVHFTDIPVHDGRAELPTQTIDNRLLRFYVQSPGAKPEGPLESVLVYPASMPYAAARDAAIPFTTYRRDIRLADHEILRAEGWDEFHAILRRESFGKQELRGMFADLLDWCRRRQVLDRADAHYGAIHSEEDKYDFRDAAAAAVCFAHAWRDTKDEAWRQRALAARSYVYQGQHVEDPANAQQYGGFCQMVDGLWGPPFRRLSDKLPNVTGVETCIAVNLLVRTIELGLEPAEEDLRRLELAARWVAANEFRPGVFHHHEGSTGDCQNSNVLGAMALARAHEALERLGRRPPAAWISAAQRGMRHYVEGQEAIGCWPYLFATIGRGQAYHERNLPDQGMGAYHFLVACRTPLFRDWPQAEDRMQRAARWWLCNSRIDRRGPLATIDLDDRKASGSLKFSAFTWCRFMAAATLLRIAEHTGEREPWQSLARRYMEHVHTKLWNHTDPHTAPVRRATRDDMKLCSWIQAAEWDAVLLRDMEARLP